MAIYLLIAYYSSFSISTMNLNLFQRQKIVKYFERVSKNREKGRYVQIFVNL